MMDYLIWCGAATGLGVILGALGYKYSALAYGAFMSVLTIIGIMAPQLVGLYAGRAVVGESGHIAGGAILRKIVVSVEMMGLLPIYIQTAIVVFIVTFFAGRIALWWRDKYGPVKAEETLEARRARILNGYGMSSMDDVRNLR